MNDTKDNTKIHSAELTDEAHPHRIQTWIGAATTLVVLLIFGLQLYKRNASQEKIAAQKKAAQQAAVAEAHAQEFWRKNEVIELKKERDLLLEKIKSESRMVQWGVDRQANPTVIEQAKARRDTHQKRLDVVKDELKKLRSK